MIVRDKFNGGEVRGTRRYRHQKCGRYSHQRKRALQVGKYTFNLDLAFRAINELDFMTVPVKDASDFGVHACPLAE